MAKLAVITHTRSEAGAPWLTECRDSVASMLPKGGVHHVLTCEHAADYQAARWSSLELGEYACFVDDDDRVANDSLQRCVDVLDSRPEVGMVFTNQLLIDEAGKPLANPHHPDRRVRYEDLAATPQTAHHLVMIRTSMLDQQAKKLSEKLGTGCDWLIKCATGLRSSAVHLKVDGYEWRQRAGQMCKADDFVQHFNSKTHVMRAYLRILVGGRDLIERLD